IPQEAYDHPDLYGLRRSSRAHAPPHRYEENNESDDDDDDDNNGDSNDYFDDDDDDDDDDDYSSRSKKRKLKKKSSKIKKSKSTKKTQEVSELRFSSRNNNKIINYAIEDDENEFLESDDDQPPPPPPLNPQQNGYSDYYYYNNDTTNTQDIDVPSDKRIQKENEIGMELDKIRDNYKFLVKWTGKSHLHNTWETFVSLKGLKGIKKLDNYIRSFIIEAFEIKHDPTVTRETLELINLDNERKLGEINEYKHIERIVDSQRIYVDNTETQLQYLVKWRRLNYEDCTWENADEIVKISPDKVKRFQARVKSKILPAYSANYGLSRPRFEKLVAQPLFIKNGILRDFQLTGLNWMAFLWSRNENGILADEMGLGKTVQTVGFISWLVFSRRQYGPHLVVVPLSTMPSWQETFDKWAPDLNCICYIGNANSRKTIRENEWYSSKKKAKFNVLLTTYEFILKDRPQLGALKWQFLAVDEAHRLKNAESSLYEALRSFKVSNRLLITGTPLQNNIKELAALVNFLMPGEFSIDQEIDFDTPNAEQETFIRDLHKRLQPYILRRLKKDVEKSLPSKTERILRVELSDLQAHYYKNILTKNYTALNAGSKGSQISLLNIMAELKKASNHPYLFDNAEQQVLEKVGMPSRENIFRGLIMSSGKMVLLDKLLTRLKKDGHRVLVFSQMVRMLDILGDYLVIKGYQFQRLDGTVPAFQRRIAIDHFNAPGSKDFLFLLSTRAGGLGINLMTADTVIIFDSDWNPQADLQAMARAHRIGQKNHVMVYRFVSKDTVEEQVLEKARKKMILEYAIISLGVTDNGTNKKNKTEPSAGELSEILKFGAGNMFKSEGNQKKLEDLNLDDVLNHAEDHITTPDLGESNLGGEEFLRQFEVTDYKANVEWDDIIPEEELQKIKEEEKKRKDEIFLQEQIEMSSRRTAALTKIQNIYNEDEDSGDERKARLKKRKAENNNFLAEKEVRTLYKSILKLGDLSDSWDQLIDDGILVGKTKEIWINTYNDLMARSKALVDEEEERREKALQELKRQALEQKEREAKGGPQSEQSPALWALKRKERKAILFDFRGVKNLNAELILSRPEDMAVIKSAVPKADPLKYKMVRNPKPVHGWTCEWLKKDDEHLLVGIYQFGFGSWPQIRDDPFLELGNKIYLNNETLTKELKKPNGEIISKTIKKVPGSVHLVRRVDYLLSLLKGKEDESVSLPASVMDKKRMRKPRNDFELNGKPPYKKKKADGVMGIRSPGMPNKNGNGNKMHPEYRRRSISKPGHDDMDENHCKVVMFPVRKSLKKLKKGGEGLDRKEWAKVLKRELIKVGDHIEKQILDEHIRKGVEKARFRKHLWLFSAYFWPIKVDSTKIMKMYSKLKSAS
ncbi:chromatin-remodeling ATPase CHD1 ASCRUDRAFT_22376, partial [Ascoidea rubescens DSM 1968]